MTQWLESDDTLPIPRHCAKFANSFSFSPRPVPLLPLLAGAAIMLRCQQL